ncbi:MAG: YbaB/EbfC family nucleoid-associated protein [Anaerolineae bacterium]
MSKKSGRRAMPMRPRIGGAGSKQDQVQRLQADFARMQEDLKGKTVSASAGGGVVEVTVNGNQEITALKLAPEVVDPEDIEMLQDLILTAVNEGLEKSRAIVNQQLSGLTGGLGLEGMF